MLFNSYSFILVFMPVVLTGFLLLARRSMAIAMLWLAVASVFFYGYWSLAALPILLLSIGFNYLAGRILLASSNENVRRRVMWAAVVVDLVALGFFKYTNFLVATFHGLFGGQPPAAYQIALPIGISFFTFTQIAFIVDCYKGLAKETKFAHYVLFVSYFPHLVAGPILHHKQMMPQFSSMTAYRLDAKTAVTALCMFAIGLAKKTLLADPLGSVADAMFNAVDLGAQPTFGSSWMGVLAYTFQIYFDFSGYSDMAIGISLLFGIALPINFNSPYKALSMIDFWRRWHISLSNFLRDYLYIPLGGNRRGEFWRYLNVIVTMLLGGLWHGASWTFVIWGGMHGCFLAVNHFWRRWRKAGLPNKHLGWLLTFVCVVFAWVSFRATSVESALRIYRAMLKPHLSDFHLLAGWWHALPSLNWHDWFDSVMPAALLALAFFIVLRLPGSSEFAAADRRVFLLSGNPVAQPVVLGAARILALGGLFGASLAMLSGVSKFLYFQF